MKKYGNNLITKTMLSFKWALLALSAEIIIYTSVIIQGLVQPELFTSSLGFFMVNVVNTICCFFIVKYCPVSILFVPLIINAFIFVMAFFNTSFGVNPWWVPVATGWAVCMMASTIGVLLRKKSSISHIQLERGKAS